jgi:hypothetical protein
MAKKLVAVPCYFQAMNELFGDYKLHCDVTYLTVAPTLQKSCRVT